MHWINLSRSPRLYINFCLTHTIYFFKKSSVLEILWKIKKLPGQGFMQPNFSTTVFNIGLS